MNRVIRWLRLSFLSANPLPFFLSWAAVFLLFSLPMLTRYPIVLLDEAWYSNTAYNIAMGNGIINTVAWQRGGDELFLYTAALAAFIHQVGFSLWTCRFFSVVLGVLTLGVSLAIFRQLALRTSVQAVGMGLMITSNIFFVLFRRARPESMFILLFVILIYCLLKYTDTKQWRWSLAAGVAAMFTFCAHPYGIMVAVASGFVILLWDSRQRCINGVVGFGAGTALVLLALTAAWHIFKEQSFWVFLYDAFFTSGRVNQGSMITTFWGSLTAFLNQYSLGIKRFYIVVFELVMLVMPWIYSARRVGDPKEAVSLNSFYLSLSIMGVLYFIGSLILFTPFFRWAFAPVHLIAIFIALGLLNTVSPNPSSRWGWTIQIAIALFGLNHLAGDVIVMSQNRHNAPFSEVAQAIQSTVSPQAVVLGNMQFWYALPDHPYYAKSTRWHLTPFHTIDAFLNQTPDLTMILAPKLFTNESPTTGERNRFDTGNITWFNIHRSYAQQHGELQQTIQKNGYGLIEIWHISGGPR